MDYAESIIKMEKQLLSKDEIYHQLKFSMKSNYK